jgi:hypothetical protein
VRRCNACGVEKALEEFPLRKGAALGHDYQCKECQADAARANRAGVKEGACAVCGDSIEGRGICSACRAAVTVLGGLDGLKRAVRAVRYLDGESE